MRNCNECRFAILEDYGYSNYTVEGTLFYCAKRLHPENGFDRFYGANPKLDFAETCTGFELGAPLEIDVDKEKLGELTPQEAHVLKIQAATDLLLGG